MCSNQSINEHIGALNLHCFHPLCSPFPAHPPRSSPPPPGPRPSRQHAEDNRKKAEYFNKLSQSSSFPRSCLPALPFPPSPGSMQSVEELRENLSTYREQLEQVSELLLEDPDNDEYKEMASGLKEVIELTEDLLSAAEQQTQEEPPPDAAGGAAAALATPFVPMAFVPATSVVVS
ncbi:unnamed protein product [Closterium sp. Yama58-4]|nr:unnamed protein product [Closterium sp. Yama58-4]